MTDAGRPRRAAYDPQALLNAQPVMVAVIDPASYIVQFQNETGMKKLGDIGGRTCHEAIVGCPVPCSFCKMPEAVRSGGMTMNEVAVSNNQHLLVQWSTAITDDGRTHVIETITDVTAHKRLEEAAHRAEKMEALGRLAGGTAHDINNLLTVITGASELVAHRKDLRDSTYDPIQQLQHAVGRIGELMRRLIAFSHHQQIHPTTLDLNAVVSELEPRIRLCCGQAIDAQVASKAASMPIIGDPHQIEQIIMTLVDNACEAMLSGGHLVLSTTTEVIGPEEAEERNVKPGMFARLDLRDTGHGIDPGTQAHLFEPYFARAHLQAGRGLGLASVYGMVRQCGGCIDVESEPGVGSLFSLWFPSSEQEPVLSPVARPLESDGHDTILLVEDDDDVRLAVSDMLKRAGYQVQEACDGLDALRQMQSMTASPHLTITDVIMPRMTGPQFAKQMHAAMPSTKILYMSGYTDQLLEPMGSQPLAFIQKPFSAGELIRKVRETLSSPHS
jgi:two-component system, cell cycle sensor histidine kinase and response regulator CckA